MDPLTRAAAVPYRYIWTSWCAWLAEHAPGCVGPHGYLSASAQSVARFLAHGPSPAASSRKGASESISPITRHRYGRLLQDVYQHAVDFGWLQANPVIAEVMGGGPTEAQRGAQILPPGVLAALAPMLPPLGSPWESRDRCLMLMLMDYAVRSGDLQRIQSADVRPTRTGLSPSFTLDISHGVHAAQDRKLDITGRTAVALARWIAQRGSLGYAGPELFFSERLRPLQRRTLFHLCARLVAQACQQAGATLPNHIGPGVVRNTVMVEWINSGRYSAADVCAIAGIQDEKTLTRALRAHLAP